MMSRYYEVGHAQAVQTRSHQNEDGADDKEDIWVKLLKEYSRQYATEDNGESVAETLQNVVGVFQDSSHNKATNGLEDDDTPDERRIALQKSIRLNLRSILRIGNDQAKGRSNARQLYIPQPNRCIGLLQDLLKIHASQTTRHAS